MVFDRVYRLTFVYAAATHDFLGICKSSRRITKQQKNLELSFCSADTAILEHRAPLKNSTTMCALKMKKEFEGIVFFGLWLQHCCNTTRCLLRKMKVSNGAVTCYYFKVLYCKTFHISELKITLEHVAVCQEIGNLNRDLDMLPLEKVIVNNYI